MLQTFVQYAAYNLWANERLTKTLSEVPDEVITSDMHDSFGSLYKTVMHLWDVEEVWWHRLQKKPLEEWPGDVFKGGMKELREKLLSASRRWESWVINFAKQNVNQKLTYSNSLPERFEQSMSEVSFTSLQSPNFPPGTGSNDAPPK